MKKTNKIISLILSLFLVLSIIPLTVNAATYSGKWGSKATWSLDTSTGVLTISGTGNTKSYHSQEKYVPWYNYRDLVTDVYIEEGVTSIGEYAFNMCDFLKNVSIPLSLTELVERTLPQVETIYYSGTKEQWRAFEVKNMYQFCAYSQACCSDGVLLPLKNMCGANVMWELDENTGLLTIYGTGDMFNYKTINILPPWYSSKDKVTDVYIENGVTSIGAISFYQCSSLKTVTIPDSVVEIGEYAFSCCSELICIEIPLSVTKINYNVFTITTTLIYPGTKAQWLDLVNKSDSSFFYRKVICSDGELLPSGTCGEDLIWTYDYDNKKLTISGTGEMFDYTVKPDGYGVIDTRPWYELKKIIKVVEIEDGVTSIGANAFEDCEALVEAQIPSTVTEIGSCAFRYCESLENVTIPDSVTEIGADAFYRCTSLKNVTIPNGVTKISIGVFDGCESLENVTIPNGVTEIGSCAFRYCESLENVTIPDSVTEISKYAFENCKNLKGVVIGEGVTKIQNNTFYGCENLSSVEMSNNVTEIGESAFYRCGHIAHFRVPTSLQKVGQSAFHNTFVKPVFSGTKEDLFEISVSSGNGGFVGAVYYFGNGEIGGIYGNGSIWTCDENTSTLTISGLGEAYDYELFTNPGYRKFSFERIVFDDGIEYITSCPRNGVQTLVLPDSLQAVHLGVFSKAKNLSKVYYTGTEEQWKQVEIYEDNEPLLNAEIVYNYCLHKYNPSQTTAATCTTHGSTKYTCKKCNSYCYDYTSNPTGHSFNEEGICETCGEKEVSTNHVNTQMLSIESVLAMVMNLLSKIFGLFSVA